MSVLKQQVNYSSNFASFFIAMSILKQQVNYSSNFASFFIATTHNPYFTFKLTHFLLWIKGSYQSPNFETSECSGENLRNFSWRFPNYKSVFLQILHHSSVPSKVTCLYFFSSSIKHTLIKRSLLKCKFWTFSSAQVKICQIPHVNFESTSQFLFKFCIILRCHNTKLLCKF